MWRGGGGGIRPTSETVFMLSIAINTAKHVCATTIIVSELNPLRPLRDLQYYHNYTTIIKHINLLNLTYLRAS